MMPIDLKLQPFQKFFTLSLISETSVGLHTSPRLCKNISQIVSYDSDLTPDELLYQFIRDFKAKSSDPLIREHLVAFLSHIAVSHTRRVLILKNVDNTERVDITYAVLCRLSQVEWVLEKFNPNHFSKLRSFSASVLGFVKRFIDGIIHDYRRQSDENFDRTDLGLLKHSSIKKIKEALLRTSQSIDKYTVAAEQAILVKKVLKEYRKAVQHSINQFTDEDYQAMVDRYNRILQRSPQSNLASLSVESLKGILKAIGQAIRQYGSTAQAKSLNALVGSDKNSTEKLDLLETQSEALLNLSDPEKTEQQQNQLEIKILIYKQVDNLPLDERRVTVLRAGLQLKQNQVTAETDIKQYNVTRIYDRALGKLLKHILQEVQAMYQEHFTSYNCEDAKAAIDELLSSSYPQYLNQILLNLSELIKPSSTQQLLELLTTKFTDYLQDLLHMVFQINGSAHEKIQHLAKEFITHPPLDDYYPYAA
jgi:RNA polymerase sigma factor (sigma-70 family)